MTTGATTTRAASFQATIVFQKNWEAVHDFIHGEYEEDGSPRRRYRYILNRGSSRSSKTHSIIQMFWMLALEHANIRLAVFRGTKKSARDTVFKDMKKVYPNMPGFHMVILNKTDLSWEFPNGSVIEINGTDEPEKIHGYNADVIWLNEPYDLSEDTFEQFKLRTSMFIIIDINPKMVHWSDKLTKDARCKFIHSTFRDNPWCPIEHKRSILSFQPVSQCDLVTEKMLSDKDAFEYDVLLNESKFDIKKLKELSRCRENERKGSASKFNWLVYGLGEKAERPNRIFSWKEISDEDYNKLTLTKYYGSDWGAVDPWAVVEVKYYDGNLYVKELNFRSENEMKAMMGMTERENVSGRPEGLVPYMFNQWNIPKTAYVCCDDNRPMKIRTLRECGWDYSIATMKYSGSIIEGISMLENLKVFYTSSSSNILLEQENYSRKLDRNGIVLEEPEDKHNHSIDAIRYVVMFLRMQGIIRPR